MKPGRHICTVCNNIYEEPNCKDCGCDVPFNSLPDTWLCPECGADKDMYQPCSCITVATSKPACEAHPDVSK
jgi:rubredoxin